MLRALRRHRAALEATPGLAAGGICFTAQLDTIMGGRPTPTRWGLLCAWESADARDDFLNDATRLRPFLDPARESWCVSLDAVRVIQGEWRGWRPSTAYGTGSHDPLQRRARAAPWFTDYFSARFRPTASTGTWEGRDPLGELRRRFSWAERVAANLVNG